VVLLLIAVATSSANCASRSSIPSGSGEPSVIATPMCPHGSPSTTIGAPASEGSSHSQLLPGGNGLGPSPHEPATVTLPSGSQRKICTSRGCRTRASSSATSAARRPNDSGGVPELAGSVGGTRRV
jgi:hypothetical protein